MTIRALLVDDDRRLTALVVEFLQANGVLVTHAPDGESALDVLRRETFDVVLLDIMMPGLDGLEVLRRLRRDDETPVIMLTAKGDDTDRVVGHILSLPISAGHTEAEADDVVAAVAITTGLVFRPHRAVRVPDSSATRPALPRRRRGPGPEDPPRGLGRLFGVAHAGPTVRVRVLAPVRPVLAARCLHGLRHARAWGRLVGDLVSARP